MTRLVDGLNRNLGRLAWLHRQFNFRQALLFHAKQMDDRDDGCKVTAWRKAFNGHRGFVRHGRAALEREGEAVQHPGNSERMFRRKSVAN